MVCYPKNTVAKYTTKLSNIIELDGDWEVGLAEISCPGSLCNVYENECELQIVNIRKEILKVCRLKRGYYRNVRDVVDALNDLVRVSPEVINLLEVREEDTMADLVHFVYHETINHVELIVKPGYGVIFNTALQSKLGFHQTRGYYFNRSMGMTPQMDVVDVRSLYVYCDLLEAVHVGDAKVPLLRIVNRPENRNKRGNLHQTMNQILYLPIQKKHFDTVEIQILDDTGIVVPFEDGKSFVVLEFRRAVHPYFWGKT